MAVIQKISLLKRKGKQFQVTLKDREDNFSIVVGEDILVKYHLHKGKELSEEEIGEIFYQEAVQKAFNQAIQYLSYRMRSEQEIYEYLRKKEFEDHIIDETVNRLKQKGYVNDLEFSKAFVLTQIRTTDKGPRLIEEGLKKKGISSAIIDRALLLYTDEEQLEKAERLAEKYVARKKHDSITQIKEKTRMFLWRKGFGQAIVDEAVKKCLDRIDEDAENDALMIQGEKYWRKYRNETEEKRVLKVKQALYRRGFPLDKIEHFIAGKTGEENV